MTEQVVAPVLDAPTSDLMKLAFAYELGAVHHARYLADGLMNRNWRIDADRGAFALKQIVDVPLATARRNLRVLGLLAADGVPVCAPVRSVDGDVVVEVDGRGYCLLPWLQGGHPRGTELSLDRVRDLGVVLARVHQSLNRLTPDAGLPDPPATLRARVTAPTAAVAEADRYLAKIAALESPQRFDQAVPATLERRKRLLAAHGHERPVDDVPRGPFGWTHGDFQHRNVIWHEGTVAGVIDWDRIRVRPVGEEVARTATVQFGADGRLDLERISEFVAAYRTLIPLAEDELADAVERLWWKRMSDYWHLEFHYDRSDHSCDDLYFPAEALLGWWTTRRIEVQAAFAGGA